MVAWGVGLVLFSTPATVYNVFELPGMNKAKSNYKKTKSIYIWVIQGHVQSKFKITEFDCMHFILWNMGIFMSRQANGVIYTLIFSFKLFLNLFLFQYFDDCRYLLHNQIREYNKITCRNTWCDYCKLLSDTLVCERWKRQVTCTYNIFLPTNFFLQII